MRTKYILILIAFFIFSTPPFYVQQSIASASIQDNSNITRFVADFARAYKKGDVKKYMNFFSHNVIQNRGDTFDKIKTDYIYLHTNYIVTLFELKISDIKEMGNSVIVDAVYNKTLVDKKTGNALINSGNVRLRLLREGTKWKIIAIDYDKYIQEDYLIGKEDVLEVSVWKSPDLSTTVMVRPDGKISIPLIGEIKVAGRSPKEVSTEIEKRLKKYMKEPIVSIIIKEVNSKAIYITGEVNKPGRYPLRSDLTLVQAITLAGGFTQWANRDKIVIIRKSPLNPEGIRFVVRYSDIVSGRNLKSNMLLQPGDTIIVP